MVHFVPARRVDMPNSEDQTLASEYPTSALQTKSCGSEEQRLATLTALGLLEPESVPIFEEATQTAARLVDAPICLLTVIDRDRQWFKSAIGLSRIGLMNELAASRQLPRSDAFCNQVVETGQVLAIHDTTKHPAFSSSLLTTRYGIRAYLGVPLLAADGCCLGTLAVLALAPREFKPHDIELLELTARWSMSEYERSMLWQAGAYDLLQPMQTNSIASAAPTEAQTRTGSLPTVSVVKVNLVHQMTQELRTPLTSILGMTSILNREIYGPLTEKQKKYMDIVHSSGQTLLSLVNEIMDLGELNDSDRSLDLQPVDIEMLCQQVLSAIHQTTQCTEQQLRLTIEPGSRIWLIDKVKVRQMIYHLVFGVLQAAGDESTVRLHISRKRQQLHLVLWTSHPWLGDSLPSALLTGRVAIAPADATATDAGSRPDANGVSKLNAPFGALTDRATRQQLSLLLSQQLAELHGGHLALQGSTEEGYRYVVSLPQAVEVADSNTP